MTSKTPASRYEVGCESLNEMLTTEKTLAHALSEAKALANSLNRKFYVYDRMARSNTTNIWYIDPDPVM